MLAIKTEDVHTILLDHEDVDEAIRDYLVKKIDGSATSHLPSRKRYDFRNAEVNLEEVRLETSFGSKVRGRIIVPIAEELMEVVVK